MLQPPLRVGPYHSRLGLIPVDLVSVEGAYRPYCLGNASPILRLQGRVQPLPSAAMDLEDADRFQSFHLPLCRPI